MRSIVIVALGLALAGCMGTNARTPLQYHVLDVPSAAARRAPAAATAQTLLVSPTTAVGFYDTQAMVYSRSAGMRAYYQLNSWTEPPSRRIGVLLVQRLQASGAFGQVAGATDRVRGTLVLDTRLEELYHDAATAPGTVRVVLTAVVTDPSRRAVVAQRRFVGSAPVPTDDAAGAVRGTAVALGPLLDDVVAWTAEAAERSGIDPSFAQSARGDWETVERKKLQP
jgi:cholesterol transport system auxiliary component